MVEKAPVRHALQQRLSRPRLQKLRVGHKQEQTEMRFERDGRTYELVCVTGVGNYSLEMSECYPQGQETFVMSACRKFGSRNVQVSMHVESLPLEVVKVFLDTAKINLVDLNGKVNGKADAAR
jgi:hypothetical protein